MGRKLTQAELFESGRRRCHACHRIRDLEAFYKDAKGKGGYAYRCKVCARSIARSDYENNTAARKETNRRYRERPEVRRKFRDSRLNKKYGVGLTEYSLMLAGQGGGCAICRTKDNGTRGRELPVDHDHETGKVRGILCDTCNRVLGLFGDDPVVIRRAIAYLEHWEESQ